MEKKYHEQIEQSVSILFRKLEGVLSETDMKRVKDAYELAREAHKEQRRKSGEPYIMHPVAVARIVAEELDLGPNPIIAAFLHDVVEDTDYTLEDIKARFGEDVAFLVGVVTKQKKQTHQSSKQIDNFRQMLASLQYDVRALLIKLADRLHNMRTLSSMRADKQMKIAGETDYFYAPLANRLGLYHVKRELENLSFRYRCPKEYAMIEELFDTYKNTRGKRVEAFSQLVGEKLAERGVDVETEVLYRTPYGVWRKMQASGTDFKHTQGKYYIRIIYKTQEQWSEKDTSLFIYSVLTDSFKELPGSVCNYIDAPKENGYQSFHLKLLSARGVWEEIHISSERMVRNSRLGCTAECTEENVFSWIEKFKSVLQDIAEHSGPMEFMEGVTSSFYNDDILVFTPEGQGIILPTNATALDFAFEIHSEIGLHAEYARINGRLQSVKTVLQRGDCLEIGTNERVEPSEDWLDAVNTYKAKRLLQTYFSGKRRLPYRRCPNCHPLPGDEVIAFKVDGEELVLHKRNCPTAIRHASQDGDSIVSVTFEEDAAFLYPVRIYIRGVDRYHLLSDLVYCITEMQGLYMTKLVTESSDHIATCTVDFLIHSLSELQTTIRTILQIEGIDEVKRIDIE